MIRELKKYSEGIPKAILHRELTYSGWLQLVKNQEVMFGEDDRELQAEYQKWLDVADGVFADLIKHTIYDNHSSTSNISLFDLIRELPLNKYAILNGLKKLYDTGQICFSLNSTPGIYTIFRMLQDDSKIWEKFIYQEDPENYENKHFKQYVRLAYRHRYKKKELDDVVWIMLELSKARYCEPTWTFVTKQEKFYKTGFFEEERM